MEKLNKKDLVIAEAEEAVAKFQWQIAQGRKELVNLEYRKKELELSFPQWEAEIEKYRSEINQIKNS